MRSTPFNIGILIFATLVALVCNVLHEDMPTALQQSFTLSVVPISTGVLISFGSRIYFSWFVVSGNFSRFSLEYWLAGSICYLLMVSAVVGLSLARRQKLYVSADWVFEFSTFVLPKALALVDIGIGIFIFALLAN
jgi:hypothetical protein